jgi:hypothetical protein
LESIDIGVCLIVGAKEELRDGLLQCLLNSRLLQLTDQRRADLIDYRFFNFVR